MLLYLNIKISAPKLKNKKCKILKFVTPTKISYKKKRVNYDFFKGNLKRVLFGFLLVFIWIGSGV